MGRIRLFRIGQTTVDLEPSFLFLVGLFVILEMESKAPIHQALLWIPILLVSVLFHEFGHAGAIRLFGFGSSEILLSGMGGVTLNRRPTIPLKEVVISAAGPACSFLLAAICGVVLVLLPASNGDPFLAALLPSMLRANVVWGIFNLAPVFPLDGGQIVKNLVRTVTTEALAVRISAVISLVLAVALVVGGMYLRQPFLAVISALFAWQNWQRFRSPQPEIDEDKPES